MQPKPEWVRQFHQPASADCTPLLIFPHAGAGASAYRALSKALRTHFDVLIFQYPGRQDRAAEAPLGTLPEIAAGAFGAFCASDRNRGRPLVAFGQSMGALVAFEFVRLAEADGIGVCQLGVSAAVAPCRTAEKPAHPIDDEEILNHLADIGGTNANVFASRDLMRLALPAIKADYRAFDVYSCSEKVTIAAPIHAMGGEQDRLVTLRDLYSWGKHTSALQVTMFDGGHFYMNEHIEAVAGLLASCAHREQPT